MVASWGGQEEWSMKRRAADEAPDSRDDPRVAAKLAALAARHSPRQAQHLGREAQESYQALAGRLAALQAAHADLADRHAALVAVYDRLLTDNAALTVERDAWRRRAADAERRADYAEAANPSRLSSFAAGVVTALTGLGGWIALGHIVAAVVRLVHRGM